MKHNAVKRQAAPLQSYDVENQLPPTLKGSNRPTVPNLFGMKYNFFNSVHRLRDSQ